MAIAVDAAFPVFFDTTGAPVDNGFIYVGTENLDPVTSQQAVYWDQDMTIQATQPLRTTGGRVARNGSPAMLYVAGAYSIEVQDANMATVYTVDSVPSTDLNKIVANTRVQRDTFDELSSITSSDLSIGAYAHVVEIDAWFQRVGASGDLDYTGLGGVIFSVLPGPDGYDPRAFGAIGDGSSDDTEALQDAINKGNVDVQRGYFKFTRTIDLPKQARTIKGSGSSDLLFAPSTAPDNAFRLERTDGVNGRIIFDTVGAVTSVADAGPLVEVEETRAVSGAAVVGAYDIVRIVNSTVSNSGGGYWRNAVRAVNAGGVVIDQTTIANFASTTAQADTDTAAIAIINSNADFSIIRALHWDQSYTQRFNRAVYVNTVNSVESVYLGQGEMVGHFYGVLLDGGGKLGACHINGTHMDCITANVRSQGSSTINVLRATGHDFRLGANGAALDNLGVNIRIESGNYISIADGFLDGASGSTGQKGVAVVNDVPGLSVTGNNFRTKDIAIDAANVTRANIQGNLFESVTTKYSVAVADAVKIDQSVSLDVSEDAYAGNLDGLAGSKKSMTVRRLGTGFTNGPSGVTGNGNVVTTIVWDANAAHQEVRAKTAPYTHWRRKFGGTWSAWASY